MEGVLLLCRAPGSYNCAGATYWMDIYVVDASIHLILGSTKKYSI